MVAGYAFIEKQLGTYNCYSADPASPLRPVDHGKTPEDEEEGQDSKENAEYEARYFRGEGPVDNDDDRLHQPQQEDDPHQNMAEEHSRVGGAGDRPGLGVLAQAEAIARLPRPIICGSDVVHTGE